MALAIIKSAAKTCLGLQGWYHIYSFDLSNAAPSGPCDQAMIPVTDGALFEEASSPEIRSLRIYAVPDSQGFAWVENRQTTGGCWYWYGETYRTRRNFWPLQPDEAKLVQVSVAELSRGRGIATRLIVDSAHYMRSLRFRRLFARIWHNHGESLRAFRKAGWRPVATVVVMRPGGIGPGMRFTWRRR
jgi:L-amino acid N-acyltransferase YncA